MYDRKVTLPLTEDEWRALCATAKSADRTPKLQARHLVRAALGLVAGAEATPTARSGGDLRTVEAVNG